MTSGLALLILAVSAVLFLLAISHVLASRIERRFPADGRTETIEGVGLHFYDSQHGDDRFADGQSADKQSADKQPDRGDLEPLLFLHGASGNARDLRGAFAGHLAGRSRLIFIDRPGSGHSQRGRGDAADPMRQAALIAGLIERRAVGRVVVVAHSLGGAVAMALALRHPDRVAGLVLLAPATHPWPGAGVTWYYRLATLPAVGHLFCRLVAVPFGHLLYRRAVKGVFKPDRVPKDYDERSAAKLVLRPRAFRHNAEDVVSLYGHVSRMSQDYPSIEVPIAVLHGEDDTIVGADYHAKRIVTQISDSRLTMLPDTGHAPGYSATAAAIGEIEWVCGRIASRDQIPDMPSLAT